MWQLILKAGISGVMIALASEVARRNTLVGGLIISLPLASILAMIWLWNDTKDAGRIAAYSTATFWFVLPTLPMFLVLPALLKNGTGFWLALGLSCLLTMILYAITMWLLPKLGITL